MMKRMICFDIDGTLLTSKKKLNPGAVAAIGKLTENPDNILAIATGRGPYMFKEIREILKINNFISYNGQYCMADGKEIYVNPLNPNELKKLVRRTSSFHIPLGFMSIHYTKTNVLGHPFVKESFQTVDHAYPIYENPYGFSEPVLQGQLFCEEWVQKQLLGKKEYFRFVRWHPYAVDILPPDGSKFEGILKLAKYHHISMDQVVAFGDGLNDLEMLQNVGYGICMENGKNSVKKIADFVTTSNDEDGIEKGLKHLCLI